MPELKKARLLPCLQYWYKSLALWHKDCYTSNDESLVNKGVRRFL
jgi:hypothetical protein